MFLAACVQLNSTADTAANLTTAEALIRRAAAAGAALITTPENTAYLGPRFHDASLAEPLDGPLATRFAKLADELGVHLLIGGLSEIAHTAEGQVDPTRCHNTSVLFGPQGDRLASYRKLHLFDVAIPGGLTIAESDNIAAGDDVVVAHTELGPIGLSICYDLRFPELYRALRDRGAEIITVPAAFTLTTGKDHWHPLLRARAIETQCWVLAPDQWGAHDEAGQRQSYGHSLVVDPWGCVVADKGQGVGLSFAEIHLSRVHAIRTQMPIASHRRVS